MRLRISPSRWALLTVAIIVSVLPVPQLDAQQQPPSADNPLAVLKQEVERILEEAGFPFDEEQEDAIILMMEDRRRASEDLFGNLMDFRAGPTEGQEADRLQSAIEWMQGEFITRLQDYLNGDQRRIWNEFIESRALRTPLFGDPSDGPAETETQYVRIHNNAYTAEDATYRFVHGGGSRGPEIVRRGGVGAFHGNVEFLIKDDALNARNPFATNKPTYQERQIRIDVSGPLLPGRLTTGISFGQDEAENVDTINATLPDSVFELGIVRPTLNRFYELRNTLQLSIASTLDLNLAHSTRRLENQGIGGFTLPERVHTSSGSDWGFEVRQFSTLSSRSIYETHFVLTSSNDETTPVGTGLQIDVLDAFETGGAQNLSENVGRNYNFGNMYTRLGEAWTLKIGTDGGYRTNRSYSEEGFEGAFTFSSLNAFVAGMPLTYRQNVGDPLLETSQFEIAVFAQNDFTLTPRLTLMAGVRYQEQTNLSDHNNIAPRLGFAYAIGQNTVLRGGAAIFHEHVPLSTTELQRRFDGTRQFEIVIDNPSYPDPFLSGTIRQTLQSVRITDPKRVAPYNFAAGVQYERTFLTNLFLSASFNVNRIIHRHRLRDLNAPLPACTTQLPASPTADETRSCRPDATRGNVLNLESTAGELEPHFRLNYRQRFSIFNATAGYTLTYIRADAPPNSPAVPSDNYNLKADWGLIGRPIHSYEATINAQLPLGVFLTSRVMADSGRRYTITTGRDNNKDTRVTDRPPGLARGTGEGPNFFSTDFNISKAFFLGRGNLNSGTNLSAFVNVTNAFNRTNLGRPSGVMTSPNFGKSTSAVNPREIEGGVRFQF